jgi:hypothetical protein
MIAFRCGWPVRRDFARTPCRAAAAQLAAENLRAQRLRRVVGYAISRSIDARFAIAALKAAVRARQPPRGCIRHSDRGWQYACEAYRQLLANHRFVGSTGRRGNPYPPAQLRHFVTSPACGCSLRLCCLPPRPALRPSAHSGRRCTTFFRPNPFVIDPDDPAEFFRAILSLMVASPPTAVCLATATYDTNGFGCRATPSWPGLSPCHPPLPCCLKKCMPSTGYDKR